jgi:anti-anti-sigma factor
MNFTIEQKDRATIFRPAETRLDSINAPELKAEFLILSQPDVEALIIDLSSVEYVDSAGLSALLLARRQQVSHDGDVRLVGVCDDVKSLLELTQLNRVFPIYETVQQAIDAPQLSAITVAPSGEQKLATAIKSAIFEAALAGGDISDSIDSDLVALLGDDEAFDDDDDDDIEDGDIEEIEEGAAGEDKAEGEVDKDADDDDEDDDDDDLDDDDFEDDDYDFDDDDDEDEEDDDL